MIGNMLNDLAEAIRRWTEKKVSEVLYPFSKNAGFADGLFVMTTATDHKNNLNRSVLKKDYTAPYG